MLQSDLYENLFKNEGMMRNHQPIILSHTSYSDVLHSEHTAHTIPHTNSNPINANILPPNCY